MSRKSDHSRFPGEDSKLKIAFRTNCNLEPRAPSTASKPAFTFVKVASDCSLTDQTDIRRPPARATESAVTMVESACCFRLLKTINQMVMAAFPPAKFD